MTMGRYVYEIDGNYGTYTITVHLSGSLSDDCDCPYPERGCKHVVAILFDLMDRQRERGFRRRSKPKFSKVNT